MLATLLIGMQNSAQKSVCLYVLLHTVKTSETSVGNIFTKVLKDGGIEVPKQGQSAACMQGKEGDDSMHQSLPIFLPQPKY